MQAPGALNLIAAFAVLLIYSIFIDGVTLETIPLFLGRPVEWIVQWAFILGLTSLAVCLGSLAVTLWLVLKLPSDFWQRPHASTPSRRHFLVCVLRNIIALVLFISGAVMLLTPGQGVLTLLAAFLISDMPFRNRILNRLLQSSRVQNGLNRLRQRFGKEPFLFSTQANESGEVR